MRCYKYSCMGSCGDTCFGFSWVYTKDWNCWVCVNAMSTIWRMPNWFTKQLHNIFPTAVYEGLNVSTFSPTISVICPLDYNYPSGCEEAPHFGFGLPFPDDSWCWGCFHVLVYHLCVFLTNFLYSCPLLIFKEGLFVHILLSCKRSLYILD